MRAELAELERLEKEPVLNHLFVLLAFVQLFVDDGGVSHDFVWCITLPNPISIQNDGY